MKTAWALPGQRDIDRMLNDIGRSDLEIARNWITTHGLTPGHVYCSTATRTRQTLEGIEPAFSTPPGVDYRDELYSGFTDEYLNCIVNHERPEALMIVGHNPTCASLANILATTGDENSLETMSYKYPTGSMAILDFEIDQWSQLRNGTGILVDFLMPKAFRTHT